MNLYEFLETFEVCFDAEIATDEGADGHFPDWYTTVISDHDRSVKHRIRWTDVTDITDNGVMIYDAKELLLMPVTSIEAGYPPFDGTSKLPIPSIHVNPWRQEGPSPKEAGEGE